jgi:hypothetical protein
MGLISANCILCSWCTWHYSERIRFQYLRVSWPYFFPLGSLLKQLFTTSVNTLKICFYTTISSGLCLSL